jgi:hypothetical protein
MRRLLDEDINFGARWGIEFVPVERRKSPFRMVSTVACGSCSHRECFHEGPCGVAHGASHNKPFLPGSFHEHSPIPFGNIRQGIRH